MISKCFCFKTIQRFLFLLIFISAVSCSKKEGNKEEPVIQPKGPLVKVMTYNIYGARPSLGEAPADVKELAEVIKKQDPDFVALQEVDAYTNRSGKTVHHAKDIAALTGMYWFFTKAIDKDGGEYGDAVLSKYPILESKRYALPVADGVGGELRSVALIKVNKDGKELYFASTHLDHLAIEDSRILQAQKIKEIVAEVTAKGGLIMGGDFNATPESQTMNIVKSYLNMGCKQQCPFTYPANAPTKTIDYILTAPVNKFIVESYTAIPYIKASDHAPVIATIRIN